LLWEPPSLLIETAAEGIMLTSPTDMVKVWPGLWSSRKAAQRTLERGDVPLLPGFVPMTYQPVGQNTKPRIAHFNPTIIPEPATWLQERLGKVTVVRLADGIKQ
jgi:hypothetical protein